MKLSNKRLQTLIDILFLLALFWLVRYWHSGQFGLYEDDLTIIPDAFQRTIYQVVRFIFSYIMQFQGQGRPLHHSFIYLFSSLGWNMGGLWGPYLIGFFITGLNIGLFYTLMRRIVNRTFALAAGLGYLLFSADTTQAYLTMSLGMQPSITLVLTALHLYLSRKFILAYTLVFLVLLGYETPFLLFLAAPLLDRPWNKKLIKEFCLHALVLGLMLICVYLFRLRFSGIGGVLDLTPSRMVLTSLSHSLVGPTIDLGTFVLRPIQTLQSLNLENGIVILGVFAVLVLVFWRLDVQPEMGIYALWLKVRSRESLPDSIRKLGRLIIIGAVLLVLAYPLTFTVRAYAISGRDTRVHAAGVAGAAVIVGCLVYFMLMVARKRWRWAVNILLAMFFALMAGYGFVIQSDYVRAWQLQKQFWVELLPLISDAGDGTVILVDRAALTDTRQIGANYWNLPRVLMQLYDFPDDMQSVPVVHRLETGWENSLLDPEGRFRADASTTYSVPNYYGEFEPDNVILIQSEDGQLVRRKTIMLGGREYLLKQLAEPLLPNLPHGFLYNLLLDP